MKIKLLKDLPWVSRGNIIETNDGTVAFGSSSLSIVDLFAGEFIEEVKDDIDIEEIRKQHTWKESWGQQFLSLSPDEHDFFTAYRIVKAVIEKLNGDWKPDMEDKDQVFWEAMWDKSDNAFKTMDCRRVSCMNIPAASEEVIKKVIALCEPELKVLFGVK